MGVFSLPDDPFSAVVFEVLDKVVGCIEQRFTKNAMTHSSNIELPISYQAK
jgi:hypothetical protein